MIDFARGGRSNHTVKCTKFLTLSRKSHHPIQNPAFPCEVREIFQFFKVNRYLVYFIESNILKGFFLNISTYESEIISNSR